MKPPTYVITFAGPGVQNGWVEVTIAHDSPRARYDAEQIALNWAHNTYGRFAGCYEEEHWRSLHVSHVYPLGCLDRVTIHHAVPPERRVFQ